MQQKEFSSISIGTKGALIMGAAKITQRSPFYDRLATPNYLNPRALAGAELMNARFNESTAEKFANAITNTAIKIRAEHPGAAPGADLNKTITNSISAELGTGQDAKNIWESRNTYLLALFDVYAILNMEPELSVGQNYDLALKIRETLFYYPDDKSKYRNEMREEQFVAVTPAQACSAVHLFLGKEAQQRAHDRKQAGDAEAWKTEIADAIKYYEDAIDFDIGNCEAIYNLSGAYAMTRQHDKAADVYRKVFELSPQIGARAYYSSFYAESAIYTKNVGRMIGALRAIEGFYALNAQYVQARDAAQDLRIALAKMLKS